MSTYIENQRPEQLTIRPPSEWRSLLLRSTRGCNWNRCRFCGVYSALGEPVFSIRPIDDVLQDVMWYRDHSSNFTAAFIGDADPLHRPLDESLKIISCLKKEIPSCKRITAYARAATLFKIGGSGIKQLADAGLSRVHIGLESGDLPTLKFHCKGQSPELVRRAVAFVKNAGIEVSYYVLLGLGGYNRWHEHIDGTITVINQTNPEFIRLRRIWLFDRKTAPVASDCPLVNNIMDGTFMQQTPEGTVHELRRLVNGIDGVTSELVCDHANNYVNVKGVFPDDKAAMLAAIDDFLSLPQAVRQQHYEKIGSQI